MLAPGNLPGTGAILAIVLPVFLVMLAGYVLRRARVFTAEADQSLLGVLIKLFVPCLAFDVIMGNEALTRPANLLLPPAMGFGVVILGFGVAKVFARFIFPDRRRRNTFACATGLLNYGYIPIPLCMALFDRDVVGVLFAFNLGVEIGMWTAGVALMSGAQDSKINWKKILSNPPIIAVLAALTLNAAGVSAWVPNAIDNAWHMLGLCAVPVGLLVTGALLADHATPHVLRGGWGTTIPGVILRLGVLPVLILTLAAVIPMDPKLRAVMIVQAAMPTAVFPVVLAKLYGGDMPTALRVVLGTSLAALVTIPLWITFGLSFFGVHFPPAW
jgi:malate permease and related proteins